MTKELKEALRILLNNLPSKPKTVLEIGSRTAKNQEKLGDLRNLVKGAKYTGLDMIKGQGVDLVANAEKIPLGNASQDLVISLETMEHAKHPWKIAREMERVVKDKGVMIVSSQQNFPIHMHPADYFRFTPYGLRSLFGDKYESLIFAISPPFNDEVNLNPQHVIVVLWQKRPEYGELLKKELMKGVTMISQHKPYRHRMQDSIKYFKRGISELGFRQEIAFFENE